MIPTTASRADLHCHSTASQESRLGVQRALVPADVVPAPMLEADPVKHSHWRETDRLMKRHAGVVGQSDAGECAVETLPHQYTE